MRSLFVAVSLVCLASPANAAGPVLASLDFTDADKPVQATYGDVTIRLTAGPTRDDRGGADTIAEIATPRGKLEVVLKGEESPSASARIIRLATGDEPQVLFQRAAVGSSACVESKLALFDHGAWKAIDLDRVCEAEGGYEVVDIDGDGLGELVSRVGYFEVFEEHRMKRASRSASSASSKAAS